MARPASRELVLDEILLCQKFPRQAQGVRRDVALSLGSGCCVVPGEPVVVLAPAPQGQGGTIKCAQKAGPDLVNTILRKRSTGRPSVGPSDPEARKNASKIPVRYR
jgi:hypothetical protein